MNGRLRQWHYPVIVLCLVAGAVFALRAALAPVAQTGARSTCAPDTATLTVDELPPRSLTGCSGAVAAARMTVSRGQVLTLRFSSGEVLAGAVSGNRSVLRVISGDDRTTRFRAVGTGVAVATVRTRYCANTERLPVVPPGTCVAMIVLVR